MGDAAAVLSVLWFFLMTVALAFCAAGRGKLHVRPIFAAFDCWIGVYWDSSKRVWYWFPVPMFGLRIWREAAHE